MNDKQIEIKKPLLTNVVEIRLILVFLLVFYHAFAPYSGGWEPILGYPEVKLYWWLDKISYASMLETFVFVSGFVYGFQVRIKGDGKLAFKPLLLGKFKRLIIPSIVFSLFYLLLFRGGVNMPVPQIVYNLVAGTGHMWFLVMLFWCFIELWIIERTNISPKIIISCLFIIASFPAQFLPLHLGHSLYYLIFFYLGYHIQRCEIAISNFYCLKWISIFAIAFIVLFPLLTFLREFFIASTGGGVIIRSVQLICCNIAKITYAIIGVFLIFSIVGYYDNKKNEPISKALIELSTLCMGVYIFQQFILKALYDLTDMPLLFGPYWLPWIGFIIAFIGSLLLSWLFHQTRVGRFLIG